MGGNPLSPAAPPGAISGVRFAPSPTGSFHIGNLRTAWISWKWAQALGEPWLLRFEDIDRPRVVMGALEAQLADLAQLGLVPARVELQTAHHQFHRSELERAAREGMAYPCTCSRREVQAALEASASAPHGPVAAYSGKCRPAKPASSQLAPGTAWRFRARNPAQDVIIGRVQLSGEFIPAYPWACALDDLAGYRLLVRAYDLEGALEVQREIQTWVRGAGFVPPAVFHTSLIVKEDGQRLEKRTRGVTLAEWVAQGRASGELCEIFARSFDARSLGDPQTLVADWRPGLVFGEAARQMSLRDLGIEIQSGSED